MPSKVDDKAPFWISLRHAERRIIEWYLEQADGRLSRAAEYAGVRPGFLGKRIRALASVGIHVRRDFKPPNPRKKPPKARSSNGASHPGLEEG
jgi:hypothetical protein